MLIEFQNSEAEIFKEALEEGEINYEVIESVRFDGDTSVLTFLISVTVPVVVAIKQIIIERFKSKKYIKVKYKDLEMIGVDEDKLERIITKIIDEQNGK
jgi:hypothetical protein